VKRLTFDEVREIGLALPNTEEGKAWGTPVLRVNGTIFAGIPRLVQSWTNPARIQFGPGARNCQHHFKRHSSQDSRCDVHMVPWRR